jgi:hypothetical protein
MKEAPFRGFFFVWNMAKMGELPVTGSQLSGMSWRIEVISVML